MAQTVADIRNRLRAVSTEEFLVLERSLKADTRKGVQDALKSTRKRLAALKVEEERLNKMYAYQEELAGGKLVLGLDEVGRGPLAGPLTIGGVVLPLDAPPIAGLNDSKQIPEAKRPEIAQTIKDIALAWTIVHIDPQEIDEAGMSACLHKAFSRAIVQIEEQGICPDVILLDGNPLHLDKREINVIKGDARCASIAAASLIAKVTRDALMVEYDSKYPGYDFASSKGYGSKRHCEAIEKQGLSPIHRASFCSGIMQETLF